ncbi:hydroxybutyrate-dimer hydrolase [Comamonas odontotermitis]|uniref:Hydroxybutyrate-dimer hydrolase n=1 Tax=Comamonas odontotermitis TaxID=379895 RepID=A0ABR6RFJ4_9BURK|nr:3-hydroxybutyrate oligomer hydrolase family protein [Comamonas odontotermitis]MBB6577931.1 hydroxybutyrate-dimer hydrolase [Comamonas odontotermitis]
MNRSKGVGAVCRGARWTTTALAGAVLVACGGGGGTSARNELPQGITEISQTSYPATSVGSGSTAATQDLLTGGIGKTGLGAAAAPTYADPASPTVAELRRNALFSNYRGILDYTAGGGYGSLYGPNITSDGVVTAGEGLVPGNEYLAVLDSGTGRKQTVIAVMVPDSFNKSKPCLVLGPSSGSRGVYGAIGTAGEWGLKKGCAVALTDAGKGVGLHNLADDTVNKVDGSRAARKDAGALSLFAANLTDAARAAYNAAFPNRIAIKHAHSQQNPEKDWGSDTLVAGHYAMYVLNARYGTKDEPVPFDRNNTVVIAGSASNGGAAVLRAAELDSDGFVDGVVASEPVTQIPSGFATTVRQGSASNNTTWHNPGGTALAEYTTWGNIYQPCAALADAAALTETSIFNYIGLAAMKARAEARCEGLAAKGLVTGSTTAERAADALSKLHAKGWTKEHDQMHNAHYGLGNGPILSAMYTMAYGRFAADANLCNTSFAAANAMGEVIAATPAALAQSAAVANGTANGSPATVVYNDSAGGARSWLMAVSPSTGKADLGLDNALCQYALVSGQDPVTGKSLSAGSVPTQAQSDAVRAGMQEVKVTGNLRGKPTIIVAGRSDALIPVNVNARAYTALNSGVEGGQSKLRYVEVTNAQHFDAFLPFAGFDTRFVPLHTYFNQAMDAVWANVTKGAALPASQVVRTTPRGGTPGAANPIAASNVPPIKETPAAADAVNVVASTPLVILPD